MSEPKTAEVKVVPGERGVPGKRSKEYRTWAHVKGRCMNPTDRSYPNYGGRGVRMNPQWAEDYSAFLSGVGRAPSPAHTLDRIDNDKGYEPGNVRWATRAQQFRNTRRTVLVDGLALVDFCSANELSYEAVQARIRRGYPISAATSPLVGHAFRAAFRGKANAR